MYGLEVFDEYLFTLVALLLRCIEACLPPPTRFSPGDMGGAFDYY
jgi:hypothetical protein